MLQKILEKYEAEKFVKADGFDEAIIGVYDDRLIYSISKCIQILLKEMPLEDAIEHFYYNVHGSHVGEQTPIWCDDYFDDFFE